MTLALALSYGGREEIARAAAALARAGGPFTEEGLRAHLFTHGLPDPDLVVRTSGEHRLSNFLLFQSAYAELRFVPTLWPDFREAELLEAILDYQSRSRRFGKL
jgi:undecaprenyl diphosphate synthase